MTAFDYEVPHPYVTGGFGACITCGMDEREADPVQCFHEYSAGPCRACPPLHHSTVVISDEDTGYGAYSYFARAMITE